MANQWKYPAILLVRLRNTTENSRKLGLHAAIQTRGFLNTQQDFYPWHRDIRLAMCHPSGHIEIVNGIANIVIELNKYSLAFKNAPCHAVRDNIHDYKHTGHSRRLLHHDIKARVYEV